MHAEGIAASSERVECLVTGTSDLANDLHAGTYARAHILSTSIETLYVCLVSDKDADDPLTDQNVGDKRK
jgi:citrate lyase beta subunit